GLAVWPGEAGATSSSLALDDSLRFPPLVSQTRRIARNRRQPGVAPRVATDFAAGGSAGAHLLPRHRPDRLAIFECVAVVFFHRLEIGTDQVGGNEDGVGNLLVSEDRPSLFERVGEAVVEREMEKPAVGFVARRE